MNISKWYWGGIRDDEIRAVYINDIVQKIKRKQRNQFTPLKYGEKFQLLAGMHNHNKTCSRHHKYYDNWLSENA